MDDYESSIFYTDDSALEDSRPDYFDLLGQFLEKKYAKNKKPLRDISAALDRVENLADIKEGPHKPSLARILQNTGAAKLQNLMSEFEALEIAKNPKIKSIDFYSPKDTSNLQSIIETVAKAAR